MVVGFYLYLYVIFLSIFLMLKPRKNPPKKPLFSLFKIVEYPCMKQKNLEKNSFKNKKIQNSIQWLHDDAALEIACKIESRVSDVLWEKLYIRHAGKQIRLGVEEENGKN